MCCIPTCIIVTYVAMWLCHCIYHVLHELCMYVVELNTFEILRHHNSGINTNHNNYYDNYHGY